MKTITQQLSTFLPLGILVNKTYNFFRSLWKPEVAVQPTSLPKAPVPEPKLTYRQLPDPALLQFADHIINCMWQNEEFVTEQKSLLYLTSYLRAYKISHRQVLSGSDLLERKVARKQVLKQLDELAKVVKLKAQLSDNPEIYAVSGFLSSKRS